MFLLTLKGIWKREQVKKNREKGVGKIKPKKGKGNKENGIGKKEQGIKKSE